MSTFLVMGASRGIGLETVKAALAKGHNVRAFARSATAIPLQHQALELFPGDALSPEDVTRALAGVDFVIQSLGVSAPRDLLFGTTLFSDATRILVDAMQRHGPKRLIAVTGAGAGNSRGRIGLLYDHLLFPVLLQRVYSDKDIAENIITGSGLEWTIVRPGGLSNRAATGRYKVLPDIADWRSGFISRANVADFLVTEALNPSMIKQTPLLIE